MLFKLVFEDSTHSHLRQVDADEPVLCGSVFRDRWLIRDDSMCATGEPGSFPEEIEMWDRVESIRQGGQLSVPYNYLRESFGLGAMSEDVRDPVPDGWDAHVEQWLFDTHLAPRGVARDAYAAHRGTFIDIEWVILNRGDAAPVAVTFGVPAMAYLTDDRGMTIRRFGRRDKSVTVQEQIEQVRGERR